MDSVSAGRGKLALGPIVEVVGPLTPQRRPFAGRMAYLLREARAGGLDARADHWVLTVLRGCRRGRRGLAGRRLRDRGRVRRGADAEDQAQGGERQVLHTSVPFLSAAVRTRRVRAQSYGEKFRPAVDKVQIA